MLDYPQVALEFMNHDHAEFIAIRADLLNLLVAQSSAPELDIVLDELLEHTRHHFAEEERLMRETRFPPYGMHKSEHDKVLADMSARVDQWKQGRNAMALRDWLDGPVGDWFVNHVQTMDFVTAGFIESRQNSD